MLKCSLLAVLFSAFFNSHALAQTDVLFDNASDGSPITKLINTAKSTIDIEVYEMEDLHVLVALQNAVQRGVRLRIVQEAAPLNGDCMVFAPAAATDTPVCQTQKKFVAWVKKQPKASYVPFDVKQLCAANAKYCYEHGKMMIVDSKLALISTGNFNASSFCDKSQKAEVCNRDYSIVTRDAGVIRVLELIFQLDLEAHPYDLRRILNTPMAARLTVSPLSLDPIVKLIQSAQSSILIQNQYLNDPTMNQALLDAAKRGVKVFVDVASTCYFQKPDDYTKDRWTKTFTAFDQAGIQSRMFTVKMQLNNLPGYLHAKMLLIDGKKLWVGSVNGSTQALSINREFGLVTAESAAIKKFSQKFSADFKHPQSETWQESMDCKRDAPAATPIKTVN